ncbi:MAG TPA: hypothetical protein VK324_11220 [Tepidisphaeraceae bacterium]|nr:hypothetical protein [Tepidisphaeraceae bacterium]
MIGPENWQAIYGDFAFASDRIVYRGAVVPPSPGAERQQATAQIGLAMSDVGFTGGSITMDVEWSEVSAFPTAQIVVFRNTLDDSQISVGIDGSAIGKPLASRFVIDLYDASRTKGGFQTLAQTSAVSREPAGRVSLRVTQVGSVIDLFADNVHVLRHVLPITMPSSQCGIFMQAAENIRITKYQVSTHERAAFVVMQFSAPYDQLFSDVIRPVVASCGFKVVRADDTVGPGLIIADIVRQIQEAEIIIADITPENQNVFYEVGYAHALGKPTILLAEKGKKLPFDVSGFRTLFYENSIAGKAAVEQGLRRHVEAISRERPSAIAV